MEELRNALKSSDVSALIPEDLEPQLIEFLYKISPLYQLLTKKRATSATHEVNLRSGVPEAWAEGELTTPVHRSSTYQRKAVQLKIFRIAGGVSHFAQSATMDFIDLLAAELDAAVEAMADLLEFQAVWGNDTDTYQTSGLDTLVSEEASGNIVDVDGSVTLSVLDNMIDQISVFRGVNRDPKVFLASPGMVSKISGLETRVGLDLTTIEYPGGLRMRTYRGIPLVEAPYTKPASTTSSPTVTATDSGGGTGPAAGTYNYKISSVTLNGEQVAGTADSVTTGAANQIDLSWTADANAKLYKVWRTGDGEADDDDNYDLLAVIAAKTYDADGNITGDVTSFADDGSYTPNTDVHPLGAGEETIWLVDMNPMRGLSAVYLPNQFGSAQAENGFMRFVPLAKTKSSEDFMLEIFAAMQLPQPEVCTAARRVAVT